MKAYSVATLQRHKDHQADCPMCADLLAALALERGEQPMQTAEVETLRAHAAALEERVTMLQGTGSGHTHRCAIVNGMWSCDKKCSKGTQDALVGRFARAAEMLLDEFKGDIPCEYSSPASRELQAILADLDATR